MTLAPREKPKGLRSTTQRVYYTAPAKLPGCAYWHGDIRSVYETAYALSIGLYSIGEGGGAYTAGYYLHSKCGGTSGAATSHPPPPIRHHSS